jgi:ankyrin repeat protein
MNSAQDFIEAIKRGDGATVSDLLAKDPSLVNAKTEEGVSAILIATYYGQQEIAQKLLEHNPTLNIFEASSVGNLDRVKVLLNDDPELVNAYAPDGFYPLGLACFFGHGEVAEFLVENRADVNMRAHNGQQVMPIHAASASGQLEIVQLLLAHGADVNAQQEGGFVPLHNAAQNGQLEMVRLFLDKGADVNAANKDGLTALHYALEGGHEAVADLLREHGAK